MQYPITVLDAFAAQQFSGNPAAVVVMETYPDDAVLQAIAAQNSLPETAFAVRRTDTEWELRWFTPNTEVPLCGHATLATAHVLFADHVPATSEITFMTRRAGKLVVRRDTANHLVMDLPANRARPASLDLGSMFAVPPMDVLLADGFLMAVLETADMVRRHVPDRAAILALPHPLIITAPGDAGYDCISRFFAPHIAIDEDPVTGAAHCVIAPYWAERLGKAAIRAWQASARGGEVFCRVVGDRVELTGRCVPYLAGEIDIA
jgi:predicted PhzF superfamily epimerase YddE/YHI9